MKRIVAAIFISVALLAFPSAPFPPAARAQTGASVGGGWQHVVVKGPHLPASGFTRVVAGGPGLVASVPGERLWASADGQRWHALPSLRYQPGDQHVWFYAAGRLLVILGANGVTPRIWASRDGGATWHQSPAHLRITALAADGNGAVAFSLAGVWTSADGLKWRPLPQPAGVFASAQILSAATDGHVLVAGGTVGPPHQRAAIWTSRDGRTWKRVPNDHQVFGTGSDGSMINDVVAGPQGILAIGQRVLTVSKGQVRQPVAWASPDGVHWQRRTLPFDDPNEYFGQVAAWTGGFIQFVNEAGETAVWSSPSGLTWTRVGSDELFGGSAHVNGAASFQKGVVAVGSFAVHPRPACLRSLDAEGADMRAFLPAALRWRPTAGPPSAPPAIDPSDPRTLKLLPADFAAVQSTRTDPHLAIEHTQDSSAYVNLCRLDPSLGPHRAYLLHFTDPELFVNGTGLSGVALSIETANASASATAFQQVERLLVAPATIQHEQELPAGVRIGEATRVFKLRLLEQEEGDHNLFTAYAVTWRKGRAIGIVIAGTQQEAAGLAERQLVHLKQAEAASRSLPLRESKQCRLLQ